MGKESEKDKEELENRLNNLLQRWQQQPDSPDLAREMTTCLEYLEASNVGIILKVKKEDLFPKSISPEHARTYSDMGEDELTFIIPRKSERDSRIGLKLKIKEVRKYLCVWNQWDHEIGNFTPSQVLPFELK